MAHSPQLRKSHYDPFRTKNDMWLTPKVTPLSESLIIIFLKTFVFFLARAYSLTQRFARTFCVLLVVVLEDESQNNFYGNALCIWYSVLLAKLSQKRCYILQGKISQIYFQNKKIEECTPKKQNDKPHFLNYRYFIYVCICFCLFKYWLLFIELYLWQNSKIMDNIC